MIITISFPYGRTNNPRKKYQMDIGRGPFDTYGESCHTMFDHNNFLPFFKMSDKAIEGWVEGEMSSNHIYLRTPRNTVQSHQYIIYGGVNKHSLAGLGFAQRGDRVWFQLPYHERFVKAIDCIRKHKTPLKEYPHWVYLSRCGDGFPFNEQISEEYLDKVISTYEAAEVTKNVPQKTGV